MKHNHCSKGGIARGPEAHSHDTHPRPRQPSLRLTSLCSKPSSRDRSSGEKESGSSTAFQEEEEEEVNRSPGRALGSGGGVEASSRR